MMKPPKKGCDEVFYRLLDIPTNASDDEIKKAYRKKALELHPDKNQGNLLVAEHFRACNDAYTALSDPDKRKVYDKYGLEGLAYVSAFPEGKAPSVAQIGLMDSPLIGLCFCLVTCVILVLVILFPALLAAKLDGKSYTWASVFVPLWILQGLLLCCMLFIGTLSEKDEEGKPTQTMTERVKAFPAVGFLKLCLYLVFEILLVIKLTDEQGGKKSFSSVVVLIPLYVAEFINLIFNCLRSAPAAYRQAKLLELLMLDPDIDEMMGGQGMIVPDYGLGYFGFLLHNHFKWLIRVLFLVFLQLRTDGGGMSFWVVFLPFIVATGLEALCLGCLEQRARTRVEKMALIVQMSKYEVPLEQAQEELDQKDSECLSRSLMNCCLVLCFAFSSVMLYASKAESDAVSAGVMLIPVWILLIVLCLMKFFADFLLQVQDDEEEGMNPVGNQYEKFLQRGPPVASENGEDGSGSGSDGGGRGASSAAPSPHPSDPTLDGGGTQSPVEEFIKEEGGLDDID